MNPSDKASNNGNIILILISIVMGVVIGIMFSSHKIGRAHV